MRLAVVTTTQPPHVQRAGVVVVVRLDPTGAARSDFARSPLKRAREQGYLHGSTGALFLGSAGPVAALAVIGSDFLYSPVT